MPVRPDTLDPVSKQRHLAALEALFTPKPPKAVPAAAPSTRSLAKIVCAKGPGDPDPQRERLVAELCAADGAERVRLATSALERAGHAVPRAQDVLLPMLHHPDERRARAAIHGLAALFEAEAPRRRTVLEGRLRRLEGLADEAETREAATALLSRLRRAEA